MPYSIFSAVPARQISATPPRLQPGQSLFYAAPYYPSRRKGGFSGMGSFLDDLANVLKIGGQTAGQIATSIRTPTINVTSPWPNPVPTFNMPIPQQLPPGYGQPETNWLPWIVAAGFGFMLLTRKR